MIIEFTVDCLGYSVGGYKKTFEIEIEEEALEGMNNDEKFEYIDKACWEYITDTLEIGIDTEI